MSHTINLTKTAGGVAVFLSLIPWYSFGLLDTDSMPWPFLGYIFFLLSLNNPIKIPKNFMIFFGILVLGIFIALFVSKDLLDQNVFRSLYNYMGVVVFFVGFYNYLQKYGFPTSIFVIVNIIWLLFGVLELLYPEIASIFSSARNEWGRGVTSLAPEATFFGIYLFFSSWLIISGNNYKLNKGLGFLILLNVTGIFFLAKSAMLAIYFVLSAMIFLLYSYLKLRWNKKIMKQTIVGGVVSFIGITVMFQTQQGSRFVELFEQIQRDAGIFTIFSIDGSLNHRLEHLVYSVHGSFSNFLIPAGFNSFASLKDIFDPAYDYFFFSAIPSNKIMSWNGDWLYQLGIFGIIFVGYLYYVSSDGTRLRRAELLLLCILLFSAIPLAFPLVSMLLALFTHQFKERLS